jgi:hypothetical protein
MGRQPWTDITVIMSIDTPTSPDTLKHATEVIRDALPMTWDNQFGAPAAARALDKAGLLARPEPDDADMLAMLFDFVKSEGYHIPHGFTPTRWGGYNGEWGLVQEAPRSIWVSFQTPSPMKLARFAMTWKPAR